MALILNSEAQLVRDSALEFFADKSPVLMLRKLRDSADADGFSRALWREMADLGWTGFLVPEAHGGSEFGMVGLGQVLEAAGRTLAATPLISTALIAASAIDLAGNETQKQTYFPGLVGGDTIFALALEEKAHHNPSHIETTAKRDGDGWVPLGRAEDVADEAQSLRRPQHR